MSWFGFGGKKDDSSSTEATYDFDANSGSSGFSSDDNSAFDSASGGMPSLGGGGE